MGHYRKKDRIYLTSRSYLKRVRTTCLLIAILGLLSSISLILLVGVTFLSLGVVAGIGLFTMLVIRYVWSNTRAVSLKGDNLIIKTMSKQNVVAPLGSVRKVNTKSVLGWHLTRVRFHLDGTFFKFFIFTKLRDESPEILIRRQLADSRKRKKEANHKPDSVLTQTA